MRKRSTNGPSTRPSKSTDFHPIRASYPALPPLALAAGDRYETLADNASSVTKELGRANGTIWVLRTHQMV